MSNVESERFFNSQILDSYAYQVAAFQDQAESLGIGIEDEISIPKMLFGALGPDGARAVTERMVQIRKDPKEMSVAEENFKSLFERDRSA